MSLEQTPIKPAFNLEQPLTSRRNTFIQHHWLRVLRLMAYKGLTPEQAADETGLSIQGIRQALDRPAVKQRLLELIEDFRSGQTARNIHVLCRIRDESSNDMAKIKAIAMLNHSTLELDHGRQTTPGLVIQVVDQQD